MSALRVSRPGEPTLLIDEGPSVGRRTPGWSGRSFSYGGAFVQGEGPRARELRLQREAMTKMRASTTAKDRERMADRRQRQKFSIHPENRT